MKLVKINETTYMYPFSHEVDQPTLGYIKGKRLSLAVDAGTNKAHVESFYKELRKQNLPLPSITCLTHWHWDHSYALPYINGYSIALERTNEKLEDMKKWQWTKEAMKKRIETGEDIPFAHEQIKKAYPNLSDITIKKADLVFSHGLLIDLGDIEVSIFHSVSPHSDDAVLIYVPSSKTVFIGDAIGVDYYNNRYLDIDKLRKLQDTLNSLDYTTCVFGHMESKNKEETNELIEEVIKNH